MKSLANGLPKEIAQQIHLAWRKNEATDRKNKRGPSYLREGSGVRVWRVLGRLGGFGSGFARGFALDL